LHAKFHQSSSLKRIIELGPIAGPPLSIELFRYLLQSRTLQQHHFAAERAFSTDDG
jgi:hypothetical protein